MNGHDSLSWGTAESQKKKQKKRQQILQISCFCLCIPEKVAKSIQFFFSSMSEKQKLRIFYKMHVEGQICLKI